MKKHLIALKLCLVGCLSISNCVGALAQSAKQRPGGCSLSVSIQRANEFADGQMAEYTKRSNAVLAEVQEIKDRAQTPDVIVPGVPNGALLSTRDVDKLHDLKRQLASISAEKNIVSNYKRDVQVIAETYRVAKLADLYGVSKDDLGDSDPRRFYFEILERLRVSQPRIDREPQLRQADICDPEVGLYLEEKVFRQQLGKSGDFKRLLNLISDIDRLRNLYDLSTNILTRGIADLKAAVLSDDASSSIGIYIASSSNAIQSMHATIVPYINRQFPSDESFEQALR